MLDVSRAHLLRSKCCTKVVLPEPRNPEITTVGMSAADDTRVGRGGSVSCVKARAVNGMEHAQAPGG